MEKSQPTQTGDHNQLNPPQNDRGVSSDASEALAPSFDSKQRHLFKIKIVIALVSIVIMILIGLIIYTSNLNTKKYYLRSNEGALEVWKGTFSPAGKKRVVIMPGVIAPEKIKPIYTQQDVYPLIFNYYVEKSDALIHVPGIFDFTDIKIYLNRALAYATTDEHRKEVQLRLNRIDRVFLYYKADVAAGKGSISSLEAAIDFLDQAAALEPDDIESELIDKKKQAVQELIKNLKAD
jgi:hypothetical protein